jgi:hypothetical protein
MMMIHAKHTAGRLTHKPHTVQIQPNKYSPTQTVVVVVVHTKYTCSKGCQ